MRPSYYVIVVAALGFVGQALAQDAKNPYPRMAPIEQYRMDRDAEIALAVSAAPATISGDATVLVLGKTGYETARKGKNGFVCAVERSWHAPFDDPEFWNPKTRSAICFNPPAVRSVLPAADKRQQWILAGLSKAQVIDSLKVAFAKGALREPAPGAMSYMMGKGSHPADAGNLAHIMFFEPFTDSSAWGHGSPFFVSQDPLDRVTVLIVPVSKWSDGSDAFTVTARAP